MLLSSLILDNGKSGDKWIYGFSQIKSCPHIIKEELLWLHKTYFNKHLCPCPSTVVVHSFKQTLATTHTLGREKVISSHCVWSGPGCLLVKLQGSGESQAVARCREKVRQLDGFSILLSLCPLAVHSATPRQDWSLSFLICGAQIIMLPSVYATPPSPLSYISYWDFSNEVGRWQGMF